MLKFTVATAQANVGKDQDRLFVNRTKGFFAVLDGLGGEADGGFAADFVMKKLRASVEKEDWWPWIVEVSDELADLNEKAGLKRLTTLALLQLDLEDDAAEIYALGDSRIFLHNQDGLKQITIDDNLLSDHTLSAEILQREFGLENFTEERRAELRDLVGQELTEEQKAKYSEAELDVLARRGQPMIRYIGKRNLNFIQHNRGPLTPGTKIILCTDGASNALDESEIDEFMTGASPDNLQEIADKMLVKIQQKMKKKQAKKDDATLVLLHFTK